MDNTTEIVADKNKLNEQLIEACKKGDYKKAKDAIDQGADVDFQVAAEYHQTPLHFSSKSMAKNFQQVRKLLLENNARRDLKLSKFGLTADNFYSTTLAFGFGDGGSGPRRRKKEDVAEEKEEKANEQVMKKQRLQVR